MRIAIYSLVFKKKDAAYIQHLFDVMEMFHVKPFVHAPYWKQLQGSIRLPEGVQQFSTKGDLLENQIDYFLTLGGDGTILRAAILIKEAEIPIVGINLGRLGFLASVNKAYIRTCVENLSESNYSLEKRRLLHLDTEPDNIFGEDHFALNDFTILKRDTSSMITIHTYINGEFLNSYWADGLIVATPTGSTGYSLSCGGPIIFPNSGNFVITPVAPHNLNVRPVVISDKSVLSFEVEGRTENYLCTLDSRHRVVNSSTRFACRRAGFDISLVRFPDREFLWTIRNKLDWGKDSRN